MGNLVQEIMNLKIKIEIKDIGPDQNLITKEDLRSGMAKILKTVTGRNIKLSQKDDQVLNRLKKSLPMLINRN